VPGDPQDVKATPLNSTSIHVSWKPPLEKDRNGIIRGYHIHAQELRDEVSFLPLKGELGKIGKIRVYRLFEIFEINLFEPLRYPKNYVFCE